MCLTRGAGIRVPNVCGAGPGCGVILDAASHCLMFGFGRCAHCIQDVHLVVPAGPPVDADSPAAMLACQSLLRLFHERLKALSAPVTGEARADVAPQRQAAAERIRHWEQQLLEQVSA